MEHTTWKFGYGRRNISIQEYYPSLSYAIKFQLLLCSVFVQYQSTHCVLSLVGTNKKEQFSDEQVGPQVAVDGAVVCVPGRPLAAQGGKAGGQTHQRYRDANPGNHIHQKLLYTDPELMRRSRQEREHKEIRLSINSTL